MYKNFRNERDSNEGLRRKEKKRKRKPEKQKRFLCYTERSAAVDMEGWR